MTGGQRVLASSGFMAFWVQRRATGSHRYMIKSHRSSPLGRDDYHLTEDLADQAIDWMARQKASAPDKPFFCYFAPAAVTHPIT